MKPAIYPFVGTMFAPTADPILKEWIINDMAAAPPHVAIGAGAGQNSYLCRYQAGCAGDVHWCNRLISDSKATIHPI